MLRIDSLLAYLNAYRQRAGMDELCVCIGNVPAYLNGIAVRQLAIALIQVRIPAAEEGLRSGYGGCTRNPGFQINKTIRIQAAVAGASSR